MAMLGGMAAGLVLVHSPAGAISGHVLFAPAGSSFPTFSDLLGVSVQSAGDVNGDGHPDFIVGAPTTSMGTGRAFVYFGGSLADTTADLVLDGEAPGDFFGQSVASAGDFNGDGYSDVIVGAWQNDTAARESGRAYLYLGGRHPDNIPDLIFRGVAEEDFLGFSVAGAGDLNGDGYADVMASATYTGPGGTGAGVEHIYFGGLAADAVADLVLTGENRGDLFGGAAPAGDVNGDGHPDVIAGAISNDAGGTNAGRAYVYFGGPGMDRVPDLVLTGEGPGDYFGRVAGAGDVNGDGFADFLVAAFASSATSPYTGRVYLYFGGASPDSIADLVLTGEAAGDDFSKIATAGDVNSDGYADLIVGASLNDGDGDAAGRVYVFLGGVAPDTVPDLVITGEAAGDRFGTSVASAGDVNGDGYSDVIVGAWGNDAGGSAGGRAYFIAIFPFDIISPNRDEVWAAGEPATVRWFGHDLADLALSVDGGFTWSTVARATGGAEVNSYTLTAPSAPTSAAKLRVSYTGLPVTRSTSDTSDGAFRIVPNDPRPLAASRPRRTLAGAAAGDYFGAALAGLDFNCDGTQDLIAGAHRNDARGADAGRAYVYFGGPGADSIPDVVLSGAAAGDEFGIALAAAGDVNGDGTTDLIVGAHRNGAGGRDAGRAYVYLGGPRPDSIPDLVLTGRAAGEFFGAAVGGADLNGDGFSDLIVGAPGSNARGARSGRVYVYFGGPGADAAPDLALDGEAAGDYFGAALAAGGDLNGDGGTDLVVGAPFNGAAGVEAGRAYVYFGGPALDRVADLVLADGTALDQFGAAVTLAGDLNGDGFADAIVGAPYDDAAGTDGGRAFVYFGTSRPDASPDLVLAGEAAGDRFGTCVGFAGDLNDDGYDDAVVGAPFNDAGGVDAGQVRVFFGGPRPDSLPDVQLTGGEPGEGAGDAIAGAGAYGAGGNLDLAVGARFGRPGGTAAGLAHVYQFNRYFLLAPNGGDTWTVGAGATIEWLGAERASVWLSTDDGASYERVAFDVGGGTANRFVLPVPRRPTAAARVRIAPARAGVLGDDVSDAPFTIEAGGVSADAPIAGMRVWPSPLGAGAALRVAFATPQGSGPQSPVIEVSLFDLTGRRVAALARGPVDASTTNTVITWPVPQARALPPGIYVVRAIAPAAGFQASRRIVVIH